MKNWWWIAVLFPLCLSLNPCSPGGFGAVLERRSAQARGREKGVGLSHPGRNHRGRQARRQRQGFPRRGRKGRAAARRSVQEKIFFHRYKVGNGKRYSRDPEADI